MIEVCFRISLMNTVNTLIKLQKLILGEQNDQ